MKFRILLISIVAFTFFYGCAGQSKSFRITSDYAPDKINRVGIIHGDYTVTQLTAARSERDRATEKPIVDQIITDIVDYLEANNIQGTVLSYDSSEFVGNPELARDLQSCKDDFYRALKEADEKKYTRKDPFLSVAVSSEIGQFAELAGTPYLLFFSGRGWYRSGGNVAKAAATSIIIGVLSGGSYIPVPVPGQMSLTMALVNAKTLEVVWLSSDSSERNPVNPYDISDISNKLLGRMIPFSQAPSGSGTGMTIPPNAYITVYTSDRGTITGTLVKSDPHEIQVKVEKDEVVMIPVTSITTVKDSHSNKLYYTTN
ncbi:MAG: hypothetical protein H8E14_05840 [Candidatus Marinimicrobia bacterium]|nr:hypothetical protein [Candidatus Neomarinimicrobiota bacterium]